jgi:SAM-dependent methyltransferase
MTELWDDRAEAYRQSKTHAEGDDLDLVVEWCAPGPGRKVLDVATGGGHVARRLREAGCEVVTTDSSPGMKPDVVSRAEDLPFADGSFDCVVTRIAPHHFADVRSGVEEMARVSNDVVVVEDTLFSDERHEQAEKLRDPTHVRNYTEDEWVELFSQAGLEVEQRQLFEKVHPLADWLARTGCEGEEAVRVKELLADRMTDDGQAWTDMKIVLKSRKSQR